VSQDEPSYATAESLDDVLNIEQLDRDLFRGIHALNADQRWSLFGGQVAAQALMAAGRTVLEERFPHSLHGYFLRRGRPDRPVLLYVDRDRDGKSFSSRHVSAVQDGEVIFSMLASFHREIESPTYDAVPNNMTPVGDGKVRESFLLEVREATPISIEDGNVRFPDSMWIRSAHPLPDDRLSQAAALTYISDLGSGFGQVRVPGLATGGPSIDHAVWFDAPVRADDWLLLNTWPVKASGARGVYGGAIRDQAGTLAATLMQEMSLRPPTPEMLERLAEIREKNLRF
jgi:acyl-CoA thioesterase II